MEQFKVGDICHVIKLGDDNIEKWFGIPYNEDVEIVTDSYQYDGTYKVLHKNGNTAWCVPERLKLINSNQINMSDELKITKQRVLDAAARCGTAKATLELLFPEAFEVNRKPITNVFCDEQRVVREIGSEDALLDGSASDPRGFLLSRQFNYAIAYNRLAITRK